MLPDQHPDSSLGILGAEPRTLPVSNLALQQAPTPSLDRPLGVRDQWMRVQHRVQWIEEQFRAMERCHAREEGRKMAAPGKQQHPPLFSSIKVLALISLMRAALAVLDELSALIPA